MTASPPRKVTHVAVGVLLRDDGRVLLADRPAGKPYAGYWEFPGGKIEAGEAVTAALERELHEELGLEIGPSFPWVTFEFDYPHAYVELQFRLIFRWRGEPHAREGQQLRFVDPAGKLPQPLLPAAVPVLRWLVLPSTIFVAEPTDHPELAATARSMNVPGPKRRSVVHVGHGGLTGEAASNVVTTQSSAGFSGTWVTSVEDLRGAALDGFDFVLVQGAGLAQVLDTSPGPLPAYVQDAAATGIGAGAGYCASGRWVDLRYRARRSEGALQGPSA